MRLSRLLLFAICLSLLAAAPASGAVRYASPTGGGASPCNPTPCSLIVAAGGANTGDQVVMAPGSYAMPIALTVNKAIEIGGAPGAAPTIRFSGGEGADVQNAGALLHDVRLEFTVGTMDRALELQTGTAERVYVDGTKGGACSLARGAIRDSVCFGGLDVAPSGAGSYQATVTNVTADPLLIGAFGGANLAAEVTNTMALPHPEGGGSEVGVEIDVSTGSSAAVAFANSSYNGVETTLSTGTEFAYTPPGTNGNQIVAPLLANASAGDFRQLEGSPTIDAGSAANGLGAFDLTGAARSQPKCVGGTPVPDIGAYEFTPTAPCPAGPTPAPVQPKIAFGKLKLNKKKGTATLAVKVPSAGRLVLSGRGVVGRKATTAVAKTLKLKIKAKGRKAKRLRKAGKVKLRVKATFTPASASELPATKTRALTLKLAP